MTLHEKKNFCLKAECKKAEFFRKCVFLRRYEIFVYDSWSEDEVFYVAL